MNKVHTELPTAASQISPGGATPLRVAYLVNQYPKVSHTFIRREILAVERQGVSVDRIAIRGWDASVVDDADRSERQKTRYVLERGVAPLIVSALRVFAATPRLFMHAALEAMRMSRHSERGLGYHVIYLAEACKILTWVRESGATHIHAHFGTNSAEVAMLVHMLGGPSYSFTVHGPDEFDNGLWMHLDKKIGRAKFVAAVNCYCRAQLFRMSSSSDWRKIKLVHCGLENDFFADNCPPPPVNGRFVCVGRLCEQKGQLILLDAFAKLRKIFGHCHLVLAGDGEMRPEIEARIRALNLADAVTITGWISSEQVRQEILASQALVLPSFQESLPVVIMEAMALRRPVISTYVAGIPELVIPGETGWLVPAGNIEQLVGAMAVCLNSPQDTLGSLGEAGYKRVSERHAIDHEAARLIQFVRSDVETAEIEEWHS